MRAIVAKRLRRSTYKCGHHSGPVEYRWEEIKLKGRRIIWRIIADSARQAYQALKRAYLAGSFAL
jgi:hypothetical protein